LVVKWVAKWEVSILILYIFFCFVVTNKAVTKILQDDILRPLLEGQLELLRYFKETHNKTRLKVTLHDFATRLGTFTYDGDADLTFEKLCQRHLMTFKEAKSTLFPTQLVELVLNALDDHEFNQLLCHISPKDSSELVFDNLFDEIKDLFSHSKTLFQWRYEALTCKATKQEYWRCSGWS